jgi:hypothetical protein
MPPARRTQGLGGGGCLQGNRGMVWGRQYSGHRSRRRLDQAGGTRGQLDLRQQWLLPRPVRFEAAAAAFEASDAREILEGLIAPEGSGWTRAARSARFGGVEPFHI